MTKEEIDKLVAKYWEEEAYMFPTDVVHSFEPRSSAITYSLVREFKPTSVLEFGTYQGGSVILNTKALLKNIKHYEYYISEMNSEYLAMTLQNTLKYCGTTPRAFGKIEDNLQHVPKKLDYVFIDTDHDVDNCVWYLKNIIPRVKKGGLIQIHDWSVKESDGHLMYEGGNFEEIKHLIWLADQGKLPFEKLYAAWDYESENTIAGSWWIKK